MSRFEEAPENVNDFLRKIIQKDFEYLSSANIKVLFDTKKRKRGDSFIFGRLKKANEMEKFLSSTDFTPDGYDYFMYLDKGVYNSLEEKDRERLIRHELCHCDVDFEAKDPYKTRDHEITDFYSEIEFNRDDPRWMERVSGIAEALYSRED